MTRTPVPTEQSPGRPEAAGSVPLVGEHTASPSGPSPDAAPDVPASDVPAPDVAAPDVAATAGAVGDRVATVAVMGSCITRDNFNTRFNPDYKQFYDCALLQNQTSLISLMSDPIEAEVVPVGWMSEFNLWNVRTELSKQFLRDLVELAPDYLILDFFGDVHFGCVELPDGRVVTNNDWKLWRTTWFEERSRAGELAPLRLEDDEEGYVQRWTEALDRFLVLVREAIPDTRVVVHRGHYATHTVIDEYPGPVLLNQFRGNKVDVERKNALWRRLDDIAVERAGADWIDLTRDGYTSHGDHAWGSFFVHYTPGYYHRFMAALHRIHLRRTADPAVAQMVEHIAAAEDAYAEDLAVRLASARRRVRRLRNRLSDVAPTSRWRSSLGQLRSVLGRSAR